MADQDAPRRRTHERVEGVRLKFRTFHHDEEPEVLWASATVWKDDERLAEVATVRLGKIEQAQPLYHAWVDAVSALHFAELSALSGVQLKSKRAAPNYKGER